MDKGFTTLDLKDFSDALAGKQPVPGGGGAAAVAGALASSLCMMVGNYTQGKKRYADVEADILRLLKSADALRLELISLVDADAEAFAPLSAAYAIPKEDPSRESVLEEATKQALKAPCDILRASAELIPLLEEMLEKGSRMLVSDVACAATLACAAIEAACANIYVNTASLKDRVYVEAIEQESDALREDACARAQDVYRRAINQIKRKGEA